MCSKDRQEAQNLPKKWLGLLDAVENGTIILTVFCLCELTDCDAPLLNAPNVGNSLSKGICSKLDVRLVAKG